MELNGNTPDYDTKPFNNHTDSKIRLSIIIKALNEQAKIEAAIRSALASARGIDAEVILADSLSTDSTVELAARYPIKIVQLINPHDRSCGIGPQLGFQFSCGEYIYLMDGDMELQPDFIRGALHQMRQHPDIAGIGGLVEEINVENIIFQSRKYQASIHMKPGVVDRLNMGGLYRRSAIQSIGYFSNRNLHSFEEFELALRLRARGWKLLRIPIISIKHYGHIIPEFKLLRRRFTSRYAQGPGELLRAALGKSYFYSVLREFKVFLIMIFYWLLMLASLLFIHNTIIWSTLAVIGLAGLTAILFKKGLRRGIYSITAWHVFGLATLLGFFKNQTDPASAIDSRLITESSMHKMDEISARPI